MANVMFFNSYKLKKGASVDDFKAATDKLHREYISTRDGFISFTHYVDGDTWADSTMFDSLDAAKKFASATGPNELAEHFYSFINFNSCRSNFFQVAPTS